MKQITFAFTFAVISLLFCSGLHAQIRIHFPHFAGHEYDWNIFQGETALTVSSGVIDPEGRVTLVMPETHKEYRGMTRWMLKKGGGLDMIYTGKGFSVECLSDQPGDDNIVYTGNPENDFLSAGHNRQQIILDKLQAVNHFLQVYTPGEHLYPTISKEQELLHHQFEQVQADQAKSSLYAARFGEIVDFTRGIADRIYENPEDHTVHFNDFVTNTLNFEDLYTSGHWDQVLHHWLMMNIRSEKGAPSFTERLEKAMNRIGADRLLGAFAQKAVPLLVQSGKDNLLPVIAACLDNNPDAGAALSGTTKHMMASFKILTGKKAPDLLLKAPVRTQTGKSADDIIIETGHLNADYTILLFYQGECPLCEDALIDLANKYKWLTEYNVRVIAVSGDESEQGFEKKLAYHQWPDNYCDFTGMTGVNFKNYAVLGIPTIYLLDQNGIVLEKSALVDDIIKIIDK